MNGARDTPPTVADWADELKLAHLALADAEQGWHQLRAELQERLQDSLAQRQAALQAQQDSEARVQAVQKHLREQAGQLRALEQRLAEMEQELSLEHAQQPP
jgi:predicted nuclease with TOPRIM domain